MTRIALLIGLTLVSCQAALAQEEPRDRALAGEWVWDAPRERWVRLGEVRRFVSEAGAPRGGFRGDRGEPPAAARPQQDLTLPGGLAAPRGSVVLRGTLDALREVTLAPQVGRASPAEHTLGRIRFEDGRTVVVNLGPSPALSELRLAAGQPIVVRAVPGDVDGETLLLAQRLRVGGQALEVDWAAAWGPPPAAPAQAPAITRPAPAPTDLLRAPLAVDLSRGAGSQLVVRGEVSAAEELELSGQRRRAVELRLEGGRRVLVVLGPTRGADAQEPGLAPGDAVAVRGRWARFGERQALVAEALRTHGGWRSLPSPR